MDIPSKASKPQSGNPHYAYFQLSKALTNLSQTKNKKSRHMAEVKIEQWTNVLKGMEDGSLQIGSRTPVADTPSWVSLEVVHGGFATGQFTASGILQNHEIELLKKLDVKGEGERLHLNTYYLSEEGQRGLIELAESGKYIVNVPEEGALLVVAWLAQKGFSEEAWIILNEIEPYFDKLRFYPQPTNDVKPTNTEISIQSVGETIRKLRDLQPNVNIHRQYEAVTIWGPLYVKFINLFLVTVEGDLPRLKLREDGSYRDQHGRYNIHGGWPCRNYTKEWADSASSLLVEYSKQRKKHQLCKRPDQVKHSFTQLRKCLAKIIEDPFSLSGREVGHIRLILARYITRNGEPNSNKHRQKVERQQQQVKGAFYEDLAQILIRRLKAYPLGSGLDSVEDIIAPIQPEDLKRNSLQSPSPVPMTLYRKIQPCLKGSINKLVDEGLIKSGEMLATLLPRLTSAIQSEGFPDSSLKGIYASVYQAFRRRRSLLLLNLQHQVKIEELPWITVLETFKGEKIETKQAAMVALKEIAQLVLLAFPHQILPNKLLQEFSGLTNTADEKWPFVDEIAADIFMGQFTQKFTDAALRASTFLRGKLYSKYYGIDWDDVEYIGQKSSKGKLFNLKKKQQSETRSFYSLCADRAGVKNSSWSVASNGMIIEQQQILTTQNLVVLFEGLSLMGVISSELFAMAQRCYRWVCQKLELRPSEWRANLIHIKNSAYAWRQMIFYLSLISDAEQRLFVEWATKELKSKYPALQSSFYPALKGLELVIQGQKIDALSASEHGVQRFLGWSDTRHWLMPNEL